MRMYKKISLIVLTLYSTNFCIAYSSEIDQYLTGLPFEMPKIEIPQFPPNSVLVTDYGAVGDGQVLNTEAFARAIDACVKKGGGEVIVPAGMWLTGPIALKSNINLHLDQGAVVIFSPNFEDYPLIKGTWEGQEEVRCISPIFGMNLKNIAITGKGIIDGSGEAWRPVKKFKMTDHQWQELLAGGGVVSDHGTMWWPSEEAARGAELIAELSQKENVSLQEYEAAREYLRPVMVNLVKCEGILLDGPTFQNSPAWNIHPLMCTNVIIRDINVRNPWYSQNGDGIDLESCKNVLVYNCNFDVGDDAICLKSGRNEYGRLRGIPSENIVIDNCIVYHGHGGFTIGSEMSGGIRNILVRKCTFLGTDVGLRFKSTRGRGGIVENIYIDDIKMKNIPTEAIRFNMFYENRAPIPEDGSGLEFVYTEPEAKAIDEGTPRFRNIHINNIICNGATQAVLLQGLPEMAIQNVHLTNILITAKRGLISVDADNLTIDNSRIIAQSGPVFTLLNNRNVSIRQVSIPQGSTEFMLVDGAKSKNIELKEIGTEINKEAISIGKKVSSDALIWD